MAQTYKNLQIIVVNDGSKDKTGDILDSYAEKDSRICVIHKKNEGVFKARIDGLKIATGDYIGFVDGDDYIEPEMYEKLLSNALKYGADISHCGYRMVFPNGRVDYYYNSGNLLQQTNIEGIKDLLEGKIVEPGLWNKLFAKELINIFLNQKEIDSSIKINEDLLMNFYLFRLSKKSVYEDFCPYCYMLRKNSAATSKINLAKIYDPIKVSRIILEETKDNLYLNAIIANKYVRQLVNVAVMSFDKRNNEEIYFKQKEIKQELKRKTKEILTDKKYSRNLKILAIWACISPGSYNGIHALYAKIRGYDKKYQVE